MRHSLRSIPADDRVVDLERAFALCDQITGDHSKSFSFSTLFLPAEKRRAIRAFYAFCRTTDDMVDVAANRCPETLANWREAARLPASRQSNPVLQAWATVREHYQVPQRYVDELIDGCEMDLTVSRYATWDALSRYCYCVASTVGLVSMHIIGVCKPKQAERAVELATELGIALQLTNILRDVGEDIRRGRIYIPQEDMRRFQYTEDDVRDGVIDARFRSLMRFEMNRADAYYDRGMTGIPLLNTDGRLAVGAASMLYRAILGKIRLNDYDVYSRRAHLTNSEKVQRLPGIYVRVRRMGDG
jgi:15-cis-phytoene synthase